MTSWRDALADVLPDDYEARLDERFSFVEGPSETIRRIETKLPVD